MEVVYILIKIGVISLFGMLLMKLVNIVFDKIVLKQTNGIHIKFLKSISSACVSILTLSMVGMQFSTTAEISKVLIQSTSLLVAVVGFAAQSVLADVISGMMISWCKPFNIGERITLRSSNITGIVEDITIRHTVIQCFDNVRVIIPNSVINKEIIQNSTYDESLAGNYLEFSVGYNSDIRKAMDIIKAVVLSHDLVIDKSKDEAVDKECSITVNRLDASGIVLKTTVWTRNVGDNFTACSDIRLLVKEEFDKNGIEIPYNYLHIVTDGEKSDA